MTTKQPGSRQGALQFLGMDAPKQRGADEMLQAYHATAALYLVQSRVSEAVASVDWTVKVDGEPSDEHPLNALWQDPNPKMTGRQFRFLQTAYRDISGESFLEVEEADSKHPSPVRLYPLPPPSVDIEQRRGQVSARISLGDRSDSVPFGRIIHSVDGTNLENPYSRGRGMAEVLAQELEIDEFAAEFLRAFFHNDATPRTVVSSKHMTSDQRERLEDRWNARHQGAAKSHQTAVINGDELSVQRLSEQFQHLNVTDLRDWHINLARRLYGVPPEVTGQVEDSNRATARAARQIMAEYVTRPRLQQLQDIWTNDIIPLFDDADRLSLEHSNPTVEDKEHTRGVMKDHPSSFTVNEIRDEAGKPPREDGNVYLREPSVVAVDAGSVEAEGDKQPSLNVDQLPDLTEQTKQIEEDDDILQFPVHVHDGSTKAPGDLPDDLTPEQISEALQPEELEGEMAEAYRGHTLDFASAEAAALGSDVDLQALNPLVRDHVEKFGAQQVVGIVETQQDNINEIIDRGIKTGKNPLDLTDDLDELYLDQIIPNRSEVIARTEMLRASNWGRYQAQRMTNIVERREWVTSMDGRQRKAHADLDGTVVKKDEPFKIRGASARFPGDFGVAGLDIQCRCTVVAKIPERAAKPTHVRAPDGGFYAGPREMMWRDFDSRLSDAEDAFLGTTRQALRKARRIVLRRAGRVLGVDVRDRLEAA